MKNFILIIVFLFGCFTQAQEEEKEKAKALETSTNLTWEANKSLSEQKFIDAEVDYRKAIAKSDQNSAAPYNLGNAYYNNETYSEAFGRFKEAGETATDKKSKHKAYHNMGNVFMKRKEYEKAVESYKEALRNNPTDEETRYNLALAKEMLKKQQDEQKKDDKKNEDKDKKEDENKDKKDGDNGDQKDNKDQDKKDEGDKGDEKKEDNKEGEGDKKEKQEKKPEDDKKGEQKQPRPNQLSKQQVQNLLEAMQNEEKKVQQKIDAKKVKGVKVKNEKDW
jgi:tetratricopeptide (TPR) repeat protein